MIRSSPRKIYQPETYQQKSRLLSSQQKEKPNLSRSRTPIQKAYQSNIKSSRRKHEIKAYHFSNAIYQGGMRAFHRTGKGLLLHDNGLIGIINSGTNRLKDHNIFLAQNIIISVLYKQHEIQFVYKNDQKILVLTMQRKENSFLIKSPGYMIELDTNFVFRLRYKSGKLVQKVALTLAQTDQIITKENFEKVMGQHHIEALKFNFFDPQNPQINIIEKENNQYHVGYIQSSPNQYSTMYQLSYSPQQSFNRQLHGLGFVIQKKALHPLKQLHYSFNIPSKGFYSHGNLQYFGQIYYRNGNHYFGRLRAGKMHGNGLLVYEKQKRFISGQFSQGKPVKLDQDITYRLDTQQGRHIYKNLRKTLHRLDPQVWIDGQFNGQPSLQYFQKELKQCVYFRYEDEEISNILKQEEDLHLSRKVENFQQEGNAFYPRTPTGRLSNDLYDRNNYLTSQYLINKSLRQEQALRRQIQIDGIRSSRYNNISNNKDPLRFQNSTSSKRQLQLDQTPIHKISNSYKNNQSELNNPHINNSIINHFTFSGQKNNQNSQRINVQGNKRQNQIFSKDLNSKLSHHQNSKININEDFQNYEILQTKSKRPLEDKFNINVFEPIERNSQQKSLSRSSRRSHSASRSLSRSQERPTFNINYQEPERKMNISSRQKRAQKTSIIDKLYSEANIRAQRLEKQYEILQKINRNTNSPYKNSPLKRPYNGQIISSPSPQRRHAFDYSPSRINPSFYQQSMTNRLIDNFIREEKSIKELAAGNESLKLANSNKVKEEKYLHYDHFTHKKKFDYTSQAYQGQGERSNRNYYNLPDPQPRTARKQKVDSVVNRLYPYQNNAAQVSSQFRSGKIFDSSYDQSRPLNKVGRTRQDDKTINFQEPVYKYSSGLKSSVLKNNVVVKS